MGLVTLNSPNGKILRKVCEPVTDVDTQVKPYLDEALHILRREAGVGLAAPQMGLLYRWYIDLAGVVHINPEIVDASEPQEMVEGCLSLPERYYKTNRFRVVTLKFTDLDGEEFTAEMEDMNAYIAQHELDHLNGVLLHDKPEAERFYAGDIRSSTRSGGTPVQQPESAQNDAESHDQTEADQLVTQ